MKKILFLIALFFSAQITANTLENKKNRRLNLKASNTTQNRFTLVNTTHNSITIQLNIAGFNLNDYWIEVKEGIYTAE